MFQGKTSDLDNLVRLLRREGISDERVLEAIGRVPRAAFVTDELKGVAYCDEALPIEAGQTISQPSVVAVMSGALGLRGDERVLEIGTGSGYQTAILCLLARWVVSVERHDDLRLQAAQRLQRLRLTNVELHRAGHTLGWPWGAPYDAIICTAAAPHIPHTLTAQLAPTEGSSLVIPVGTRELQQLLLVYRNNDGGLSQQALGPVRFVPLIGPDAWANE